MTAHASGWTLGDPILIHDCTELQAMNTYQYYKLNDNISCSATSGWNSGAGFMPIGSVSDGFTGNFNGNHKIISDLFINRPSDSSVGMFGATASGSSIYDVGLENVNFTGQVRVGGLVGYLYAGTVTNSYATGTVSGSGNNVGGLVGQQYNSGTITNSFSNVIVSGGGSDTGGLVGSNGGTITGSYALGAVSSSHVYTGGLVGINTGSITYSYSAGAVNATGGGVGGFVGADYGSTSNSFWDKETSGKTTSSGSAVGKTTAEMTTQATFSAWTFDSTHWHDLDSNNSGYPYLSWQTFGGGGTPPSIPVPEFSTYILFITLSIGGWMMVRKMQEHKM